MSVRNWCFTIHEDHSGDVERLASHADTRYLVWQTEVCPTTERTHIQGYVELTRAKRLAGMRKICPAHYERRMGTRDQARDYCMKEDTRAPGQTPNEVGEWATTPGKRNDLEVVKRAINDGANLMELFDDHFATTCRYYKAFEKYKMLAQPRRDWKTFIKVYWGASGTGKSRKAHADYPDAYVQDGSKWFDAYDGQAEVIIDDYYGDLPIAAFLRLIDRYACQVPNKGGYVNWIPKTMVITSNVHPRDWYPDLIPEHKVALMRRLDEIKMFEAGTDAVPPSQALSFL